MAVKGTLMFFCGKMGAGKTTKSQQLAQEFNSILISEDEWLATIYPDEINDFNDYLKYSSRLKPLLKSHIQHILNSGVSVIIDFPGNTKNQRMWFKEIFTEYGAPHKLFYLKASDDLCIEQLGQRRLSQPERAAFDTEEMFRRVNSYFQPPTEDEGFDIEVLERNA